MKMNTALIVIVLFAVAFGLFYLSQQQNSASKMNPETLKQKIDSGVVIDVRTSEEYANGHLVKAKHNWDVMSGEFQENLDSLDKDQTYYLYCRSGNRSGKATGIMKENGFENVHNIGGYQDLVDAGLESTK